MPKPVKKNETKPIEEKIIVKKEKKSGFIIPKKKPLIVGSEKTTNIKKSKYYKKKDFNLAKKLTGLFNKYKMIGLPSPSSINLAPPISVSKDEVVSGDYQDGANLQVHGTITNLKINDCIMVDGNYSDRKSVV